MPIGLEELEINHYIAFVGDSVPQGRQSLFYQIQGKEPVTYETGRSTTAEFTAVASGGNAGFKNIEVLEPDTHHLYGLDWGVKDRCRYYMKVPTGNDRLGLDEDMDVGFVNNKTSPWLRPNPHYGFWIVEDQYPSFNAYNDSPLSLTPKIYFYGYKYFMVEVTKGNPVYERLKAYRDGRGGQKYTNITLGGIER